MSLLTNTWFKKNKRNWSSSWH